MRGPTAAAGIAGVVLTPLAMNDEMVCDRLVVGLLDISLSERMQMDPQLTLQKAVDLARSSEHVKKQQVALSSQDQSSIEAVRSNPRRSQQHQGSTKPCNWCGYAKSHPRSNCPAKNSRCLKCGKLGHFKRVCRSRVQMVNEQNCYDEDNASFLGNITDC